MSLNDVTLTNETVLIPQSTTHKGRRSAMRWRFDSTSRERRLL